MDQNKQEIKIPTEVREFLEGILEDANMPSVDEDMHEQMIGQLFARLDSFISSTLVDKMPQEKLEEFLKMNEEGASKQDSENFIAENLPDAKEVLAKAFTDFRAMYLEGVAKSRNSDTDVDENEAADAPTSYGEPKAASAHSSYGGPKAADAHLSYGEPKEEE